MNITQELKTLLNPYLYDLYGKKIEALAESDKNAAIRQVLEKLKMQVNTSGYSSGIYDTSDEKTRTVWFEASKQRQEDNDYFIDVALASLPGVEPQESL